MSPHNDIVNLQRRIDHLTHAAGRLRQQLADLHAEAWEAAVHETEPTRSQGFESRPPPGAGRDMAEVGHPDPKQPVSRRDQAHHLWARTEVELGRVEAVLVGLERAVTGWFMVTAILEPTRGSLIPAAEHARLLANQRARAKNGQYTPARLMDQQDHPGKGRL